MTHTYPDNGEFEVSLTVENVLGKTTTITRKVMVENLEPEIIPLSEKEQQITKGEEAIFSVQAKDPGLEDQIVEFSWNFGDGSDPFVVAPDESGTSEVTHVYGKKGAFTARVSAKDDDDGKTKFIFFVKVAEGPIAEIAELSSSLGDQPGLEGESVTFSATVSNAGEARLFYNWDFGYGEQTGGIGKSEIEHTYKNEGSYIIKLGVSDSPSIEVAKEIAVTIENIPPKVMTDSPYQVEEGRSITLDASKSTDLDKLTFAWDLGDGQTEPGESISYTPPNVGANVVTVTISDGVDEVEQDVVVEVTNVAPVVDAGGPYSGQVGADIVIDGASAQDSSDPTGETFTYTWDLDADGTFEKTGQQVDFRSL